MARRQYLSVRIGIQSRRVFLDDIIRIHKQVKKIKPKIPIYYDDILNEKQECNGYNS
jgi:hypothetical protein